MFIISFKAQMAPLLLIPCMVEIRFSLCARFSPSFESTREEMNMKAKPLFLGLLLLLLFLMAAPSSRASYVLSPTGVHSDPGHFSYAEIGHTIDQSGLLTGFTSGKTNWDEYISGNPRHLPNTEYEWFAPMGTKESTIVYDLGGAYSIDQIALWNEADVGISQFTVWLSDSVHLTDGHSFSDTFYPTDTSNAAAPYYAEIYSLGGIYEARYVHFRGIGTDDYFGMDWVSMGEIAFSATPTHAPLPPAAFLLFSGLLGVASLRRFSR